MMQNKWMMSNFKWRFNKQFYSKMWHFLDWMTLVRINSKQDVFLRIKKLLVRNQNMSNSSEMSHMKVHEFQSEVAPEELLSLQALRTIRMTNCFQILILSSLKQLQILNAVFQSLSVKISIIIHQKKASHQLEVLVMKRLPSMFKPKML